MKVHRFDRQNGVYHFSAVDIATELHAHPATELLYVPHGCVTVALADDRRLTGQLVLIPANVRHRVVAATGGIEILLVEVAAESLTEFQETFGLLPDQGIYLSQQLPDHGHPVNFLVNRVHHERPLLSADQRVQLSLTYLNDSTASYGEMMTHLSAATRLSESRLSHLFKQEVGVSVKRYLVWARLKRAFELVLTRELTMYEAALRSGFYDQAHLSKAFRQLLGIAPSTVYNSGTVQG